MLPSQVIDVPSVDLHCKMTSWLGRSFVSGKGRVSGACIFLSMKKVMPAITSLKWVLS